MTFSRNWFPAELRAEQTIQTLTQTPQSSTHSCALHEYHISTPTSDRVSY